MDIRTTEEPKLPSPAVFFFILETNCWAAVVVLRSNESIEIQRKGFITAVIPYTQMERKANGSAILPSLVQLLKQWRTAVVALQSNGKVELQHGYSISASGWISGWPEVLFAKRFPFQSRDFLLQTGRLL